MRNKFDSRTKMLRKGKTVFNTKLDADGRHKPVENETFEVLRDCILETFRWFRPDGIVPVKVPIGFLGGNPYKIRNYNIVWVREEDIESY